MDAHPLRLGKLGAEAGRPTRLAAFPVRASVQPYDPGVCRPARQGLQPRAPGLWTRVLSADPSNEDPTPSKGVGFGCATIPKDIEYGCKLSQTQQPYTLGVIPCYIFGQNLSLGALPCLPRAAGRLNKVVDCELLGTANTMTQ
ncbi:hypothetical protein H0E87_018178 [Populus deltoides]|uniref:Uncharacterized protein n=1 Tax=Populus deltoides TaxID=3696 RepID=A0A8T2XPH5_POPDE|nr:hypothetical protein H0E87_018178 [Populus deltoides]